MESNFNFEFIKGSKKFSTGKEALSFALQNNCLNLMDRGSLAVSLFDIHETDHYGNATQLRRSTPPEKLEVLARALVKEVQLNGWKNHVFCKRLNSKDSRLISQLEGYRIHIT